MIDLKLDATGDLELSAAGDISATDSIVQAVRIRLLWFFGEWRLMPSLGFPFFENLLLKGYMVFNGPSIYPDLMFFVFSIKSVDDIYDFLSILVLLAAVDEVSLDML